MCMKVPYISERQLVQVQLAKIKVVVFVFAGCLSPFLSTAWRWTLASWLGTSTSTHSSPLLLKSPDTLLSWWPSPLDRAAQLASARPRFWTVYSCCRPYHLRLVSRGSWITNCCNFPRYLYIFRRCRYSANCRFTVVGVTEPTSSAPLFSENFHRHQNTRKLLDITIIFDRRCHS